MAWVRHGLFGPHLHCGNQRCAHGVMKRHIPSHAYSCLFDSCYRNTLATATVMALYSCSSRSLSLSSSSQSSLKRMRLRFKQRQSRKKALLLISQSVCLSCIPFNSATSKCVDNTTSLRVSLSLHVAAITLLWEAFTNVSDTIRISPFTAFFFCLHHFIKPCRAVPYWASMPSWHGTFQFVFTLTLQTVRCRAGPLF